MHKKLKIKSLDELGALKVIVTNNDIRNVQAMLSKDRNTKLTCAICNDTRFDVEVITRSKMSLVTGAENVIIVDRDEEEVHVTKVLCCAVCSSKAFINRPKAS